jgi:hypothetical protein
MVKKITLFSLAALAVIVAGVWAGNARAAASTRVFELRTYYCYPGKLDALKTRFREHTTKIFEKHGMQNIGYWTFEDEPLKDNTLVYIIAHESRDAAKKNWAEFGADPEWQKVRADSEANGKIVEKVDSKFLDPTDFSKLQ